MFGFSEPFWACRYEELVQCIMTELDAQAFIGSWLDQEYEQSYHPSQAFTFRLVPLWLMMLKPTLITYTIIYTLVFWYRFSCAVMFYSLIGVVMCLRCFDSRFAFLLDRCAWAGPLDPPEAWSHEAILWRYPWGPGWKIEKKAMCFKHNKIIQNDNEPHNFWNWSSGGFLGQVVHVCATCDMLMIVDAQLLTVKSHLCKGIFGIVTLCFWICWNWPRSLSRYADRQCYMRESIFATPWTFSWLDFERHREALSRPRSLGP